MHERICTVCSCKDGKNVAATHVAQGYSDDEICIQWFECDSHGPTDHLGFTRTIKITIAEFYERIKSQHDRNGATWKKPD